MKALFELFKATSDMSTVNKYDSRKVDRTEIDTIIVSTAFTTDMGYETAIIHNKGNTVSPVERYDSRTSAEEGHIKWCEQIKNMDTIIELGYGDLSDDEEKQLIR